MTHSHARLPEDLGFVDRAARRLVDLGVLWLGLSVVVGCADPAHGPEPDPAVTTGEIASMTTASLPPPIVHAGNLYDHEAYWPYHVELTEPWRPADFEGEQFAWGAGSIGVLVRVEPSGALRVDFGRFGKHLVPVEVTGVIEEANEVARGERKKGRPNFVLAVINKLADPTTDPVRFVSPSSVDDVKGYVVVAADPSSEAFRSLASTVGPIGERDDVMLVLLPQGRHTDAEVLDLCRSAGWNGPFAHSRFARAYTESVLGDDIALPGLILQTPEGRVLYASTWTEAAAPALRTAIEHELGADPARGMEPSARGV